MLTYSGAMLGASGLRTAAALRMVSTSACAVGSPVSRTRVLSAGDDLSVLDDDRAERTTPPVVHRLPGQPARLDHESSSEPSLLTFSSADLEVLVVDRIAPGPAPTPAVIGEGRHRR